MNSRNRLKHIWSRTKYTCHCCSLSRKEARKLSKKLRRKVDNQEIKEQEMTDEIEFQIGDWVIGDSYEGEVIDKCAYWENGQFNRDIKVRISWPPKEQNKELWILEYRLKKASPKIEDGDLVEFGGEDFYIRGWACLDPDGVVDICADETLQEIIFSPFDGVRLVRKSKKGE